MSNRIRLVATLSVIGLIAAACSSTASSPSTSESPLASASAVVSPSESASSESPTLSPSESASESPSASAETSASPAASAMTADQLVAAIPTSVGGKTLTVKTAKPSELPLLTGKEGATALASLLSRLGVKDTDAAAALGTTSDSSITIGALSINGVDPTMLSVFFFSSAQSGLAAPVVLSQLTISGKNVTQFGPKTKQGFTYIYPTGSTVFIVVTADASLASDAFSKLP